MGDLHSSRRTPHAIPAPRTIGARSSRPGIGPIADFDPHRRETTVDDRLPDRGRLDGRPRPEGDVAVPFVQIETYLANAVDALDRAQNAVRSAGSGDAPYLEHRVGGGRVELDPVSAVRAAATGQADDRCEHQRSDQTSCNQNGASIHISVRRADANADDKQPTAPFYWAVARRSTSFALGIEEIRGENCPGFREQRYRDHYG